MKFRPDLEGLRALAVVPVVVFHAWPSAMPGGFVGVDIFFVISGYLITTLLLQRLAEGSYSITAFYAARIRRIFPALFAMLALVVPACWLLLEPQMLSEFARLLGATGLFISNLELYRTSGYFQAEAELKPLLHTWSLAVEEQYYIVFPPLLALLWRFARPAIGWALLLTGLLSLAYCLRLMPVDAEFAFYAAPARAFELMIGSGLAWWMARGEPGQPLPAGLRALVGWGALAALLGSLVVLRADHAFPGPMALWPCLATAALIWVGRDGQAGATRCLSIAPLRWIGAMSFSLYLWHWPVLVLMRHALLEMPTPAQAGLGVALSVALAWMSWRWVEAPVRQARLSERVLLAAGVVAIVLSLVAAWGLVKAAQGRQAQSGTEALLRAGATDISVDRRRCHSSGRRWLTYDERCLFGPESAPRTLVVWGDSHGVELARALGDAVQSRRVAQLTGSTCPPALDYHPPGRPQCADANRQWLERIVADPGVDVVLLAARHEFYLKARSAAAFEAGMAEAVRRLRAAGKRVLLLDPLPVYHYPVPAALAQRSLRGQDLDAQGLTPQIYAERQGPALALVERLAAHSGAVRVPVADWLCGATHCQVRDGAHSLYFDDNHLSMRGAAQFAPRILQLADEPTAGEGAR